MIKSNYRGNGRSCSFSPFFLALPWCSVCVMISFIRPGAGSDRREMVVMRRELFGSIGWKHWLCEALTRASCWSTEGAETEGSRAREWASPAADTDCSSRARRSVPVVKSILSTDSAPPGISLLAPPVNRSSLQDHTNVLLHTVKLTCWDFQLAFLL